ncbi:MAG: hypothetical protein IT211_04410 [Armatimonadetes bacterium]|nr:hypothetical protein [Armatimonadota bacterium]
MPPFQGLEYCWFTATQGVALGYGSVPRWGVESDGVAVGTPILLRDYTHFAQMLNNEYGIEPSRQLRELKGTIAAG